MAAIAFSHIADGLYGSETHPALFLYSDGSENATRSLADLKSESSALIFCETPPADLEDFARRIKAFYRDSSLKIIWLTEPDLLEDPAKLRGLKFKGNRLAERGLIRFRNYLLYLHPGSTLSLADEQLIIKAPTGKKSPIELSYERGNRSAGTPEGDVTIELTQIRPGRVEFKLTLQEEELTRLDAGIRYFFPDEAGDPGMIESFRFPIFSPGETKLLCQARLHPLHALRRESEKPETLLQLPTTAPILTYFRNPLGQPLWLTPVDGAGFIFERKTETLSGARSDAWYLTPWGTFAISAKDEKYPSLMPGATGTEYFQGGFNGSPFYVTFLNGCEAYLPGFKRNPQDNQSGETDESLLIDNLATTSYLRFHGGKATYFAQPAEQPFYLPGGSDDSASYLATPFANLTDWPEATIPERRECVPVLPLAGIEPDEATLAIRLERRMAAPLRSNGMKRYQKDEEGNAKTAYSPIPVNTAGSAKPKRGVAGPAMDGLTTVTPGGYIGNFSHDLAEWQRMLITTGSDKKTFTIRNINGPLRNALLAGNRFGVISDPLLFLKENAAFENNLLDLAGWGFDLNPEQWLRYGTVLLFKDHPESIAELAGRPGEWTEGQYLNVDPYQISERLLASGEVARQAVDNGDLDFAPFLYQIWENPSWNGFLALNVRVSPLGFPDDLAVIAGGVDPAKLMAHHVGVSTSSLERQESGAILNGRGALFGLVNYEDDNPFSFESSYDWVVRKLRARFRNSNLQNFQARIDLGIRQLFGDPATAPTNDPEERPIDTIILNGHYEEHDGKGRYTFRSTEKVRFQMESGVVAESLFNRASFETTSVIKSDDGEKMDVRGRFLLGGEIKFNALPDFDIFSFDKLPLQNLGLNLAFGVDASAVSRPASTIDFSITPMRIKPKTAESRANALANRFPLALDSLRELPANGLKGLKLAAVVSPLAQTTREEPGYQLNYRLDLGIKIKCFLTIAWWPSGSEAAVHMGLRIPGFDGAFNIVDKLVELGPEQIQFTVDPESGETILLFRRIGVRMPLGLSLPVDGSIDAALFGDPDGGGSGKIAWYAAWNKPG